MDIKVQIDFGSETLAAINNLAASLTGKTPAPVASNNLKDVPKEPAKKEEPKAEEKATETGSEQTEGVKATLVMIRELVDRKKATSKDAIVKLISEFGAKNVSTLPADKYDEFYQKVNAL